MYDNYEFRNPRPVRNNAVILFFGMVLFAVMGFFIVACLASLIFATPLIPMLIANAYGGPQLAAAVGLIIIFGVLASNASRRRCHRRAHYSVADEDIEQGLEPIVQKENEIDKMLARQDEAKKQEKHSIIDQNGYKIDHDVQAAFLKNLLDVTPGDQHRDKLEEKQESPASTLEL